MKREIKFRGWNIILNEMMNVHDVPYGYNEILNSDEFISMQFTGLLDKNGKEIYEGDIVKTVTDKLMVIGWSERHASFVIDRNGWAFRHFFGEAFESNECEVVGNIHENPELLKSNC